MNKPWSTRQLREAFAAGAEAFGWSKRSREPRLMREGTQPYRLWPGGRHLSRSPHTRRWALVRILADGTVEVASSGTDMGQGTYTILAQTAAEVVGVPVDRVRVKLGDSSLPRAPVSGGSQLANLMTGAVHKAAMAAREVS